MVAVDYVPPIHKKAKAAAIYGFLYFLIQFVEELSSMTCWATNHKWRFAQTGSALIELTGTTLRLVGVVIHLPWAHHPPLLFLHCCPDRVGQYGLKMILGYRFFYAFSWSPSQYSEKMQIQISQYFWPVTSILILLQYCSDDHRYFHITITLWGFQLYDIHCWRRFSVIHVI